MSKFIWQEVVIEDRAGVVTHYGRTGPLEAETLSDAQIEVDRTKPVIDPWPPCVRILEGTRVLSSRMFDRDGSRPRWS